MAERPFVTLKLATSLDGRIATASGESRWITGPEAREAVHRLRAEHDAVLVGVETALADDPELTVRLTDYAGPQPARVVLDSRQRITTDARLVRGARDIPTLVFTVEPPQARLVEAGVRVETVSPDSGRVDLTEVLAILSRDGVSRLFVEGGGAVAASFLRAGLVDALEWFRAPILLGAEGRPAIGALALAALARAPRFERRSVVAVGQDLWERYVRV
jgi:diaminohydroxyphosphoribosylaminopyrimidine deaminase/5-amino-6-(5-phosphoribosylamino)uracil reductase